MSTLRELYVRHGTSLREFVKFGLIGGSGIAVNLMAIGLAHNVFFHGFALGDDFAVWNIPGTRWSVRMYHLYAIFAFFVANAYNFVLNRYWTFRGDRRAPFFHEFLPFMTVGLVAQGVGLIILTLLRNPTSPLYLSAAFFTDTGPIWTKRLYWAQLIQVVLVMPINFLVNKLWTFRIIRRRHHARVGSQP
ncbi:MAG: GtrA family protein [Propionibacteriaceae bacterium]|nr:GtrA family protein [Propionibacteriaceae bacterium]